MSLWKPSAPRYSESEKDHAVRMVLQLRNEFGTERGTFERVAQQVRISAESLRGWTLYRRRYGIHGHSLSCRKALSTPLMGP